MFGLNVVFIPRCLVKAVEDETAREHAAEEKERAANRAKAPKSAEAWTANMPETYLKGYLGTGEGQGDGGCQWFHQAHDGESSFMKV